MISISKNNQITEEKIGHEQDHAVRRSAARSFSSMLVCAFAAAFFLLSAAVASAVTVTPNTWNVIGLDSNTPTLGPNRFPVGAQVCSTNATETVNFVWDDGNNAYTGDPYINLRLFSKQTVTVNTAGGCAEAYFEVEVTKDPNAFNKTRSYHITAGAASTPVPRTLLVEHLVSQGRNAITDMQVGTSLASLQTVAAGGSMSLAVGNTYYIKMYGYTATMGYQQLESFINFPNTVFQVLSVNTTYDADTSAYVASPNDKLYGDACLWENDPTSPYYLSCLSDGKIGGNITVTYQVQIVSGGGSTETLNTLIHDFSGSSFHYNSDYSTSARFANIIDPTKVTIDKSFSPNPSSVNGVSTLTFVLTNPNAGVVSGLTFTDTFPTTPGAMVVSSPSITSTSGCGSPTFTPAAGATSISFANGTIAANSTCTVQVNVTVPATGTYPATYTNTSGHLFVGAVDTNDTATASLTISDQPAQPSPAPSCAAPVELARWNFDTLTVGADLAPLASYIAPDVPSATASITGSSSSTIDNTQSSSVANSWQSAGWTTTTTDVPTTPAYIDFALDTTNYGGVQIRFSSYAKSGTWGGTNFIYVHSNTNSAPTFTTIGTITGIPTAWASNAYAAAATGSSATTFRLNAAGSKINPAPSPLYLDDVIFTGCTRPTSTNLTITKSFAPQQVAVAAASTLTFVLSNLNSASTATLTGVGFTDTLPLQALQGTVGVVNTSPTVTGTGTAFKTQLAVGSNVVISGATYTVSSIASDTLLTLTANSLVTGPTLTLATGLTVYTGSSTQCGGTVTTTAPNTISLANGTLASGATCNVIATVKASSAGAHNNVSGFIYSTATGTNTSSTGSARATMAAVLPPVIAKQFSPNPILVNGVSTLSFLVTNPNQDLASGTLTGVGFSDTFPTSPGSMVVASTPAASSTCGGSITAAAGTGSMSFANGTIAPGATCTIKLNVTAPVQSQMVTVASIASDTSLQLSANYAGSTASGLAVSKNLTSAISGTVSVTNGSKAVIGTNTKFLTDLSVGSVIYIGTYRNTSGLVSATTAGNGNTATDTLTVSQAHPALSVFSELATSNTATTNWDYYLVLPAGNSVYYRFQVQNDGDAILSSVTVTDSRVDTSLCSWQDGGGASLTSPFTLQVATASSTNDFAICTLGPFPAGGASAVQGSYQNDTYADGTFSGTHATDTDWALYETTGLSLAKSATESHFRAADDVLHYSYTVTNSGYGTLVGPVTVADDRSTNEACPVLSTVGNFDNYLDAGESLVCSATYTVTAGDVAAKLITNIATASTSTTAYYNIPAVTSPSASKTIPLAADLTATKTNNRNGKVPVGGSFNWRLMVSNPASAGTATFNDTQTLLKDDLPASGAVYSAPTRTVSAGTTGTISCGVLTSTLTCTATGTVVIPPGDSFSTVISVATSTALTLVNPRSAGVCGADPDGVIPELNEGNNGCGNNVEVLNLPSLTVVKSVTAYSDTENGTTSPKAIPGSEMEYTVQVMNSGPGIADTIELTDPIPANTELVVRDINGAGTGPVLFADGTVPSGLCFDYANAGACTGDNLLFSHGGGPFVSTFTADGNGCDATVSHVKIVLGGSMSASDGTNHPSFLVRFRVRVK